MNIAVLNYHRIGGSGVIAYEIGRAMAEHFGHDVHFVGSDAPFRLLESDNEKLYFHKIWVKDYPVFDFQPYTLALASQLADIIDRYNIDIIHSHYALPHAIGAILAREIASKKVKCITTLHGTDITVVGTHPTMKNITRYAINSSDAVTSVSNFLKQKTESTLDIGQKKIQTIYNFINPLNFNPNLKRNQLCKTSKGRCAIVHVSNLRQVKSPLNMLKIFKGIHEAGVKEVELKIVGEGPMEIKMREWCADNRIEDLVQFMGVRSNIGNILASSYLMLLPSKFESFGLVALEAMACGVPVVASNTGGIPEVIDDGVNGILFESENIEQAICKAVDLISNPERLQAMRKACVEQVNTKFEFNKIIKQYEHLYRSLVV